MIIVNRGCLEVCHLISLCSVFSLILRMNCIHFLSEQHECDTFSRWHKNGYHSNIFFIWNVLTDIQSLMPFGLRRKKSKLSKHPLGSKNTPNSVQGLMPYFRYISALHCCHFNFRGFQMITQHQKSPTACKNLFNPYFSCFVIFGEINIRCVWKADKISIFSWTIIFLNDSFRAFD